MEEIPKDRFVGVFCPAGVRSTMVYTYLLSKGFEFDQVRILEGGYAALTEALKPNKVWRQYKRSKFFRVAAKNNCTRLRRISVRLQGTFVGAYQDMCR